ncbi:NeuD/PglB/VioB family sugar acetyltransferase [Pseudomonas gessardii]|uniref:NeuD/PglB/VioB family sugar acetyltransferase n=1 Tax=Pseudomonas gessardii TaxID=78544 RepID=UPI001475E891|nr:acetyltransferase [Pseudomonas gessardii]
MEKIVVVGSSGHAKVIVDIVEKQARYAILGFIDGFRQSGAQTLGYQVIGNELDLPRLIDEHDIRGAIVAIGDNAVREDVVTRIATLCPHLMFINAIHPSAVIGSDVSIGVGTVIMAGVVINPSCRIGNFCIVNTKASLDHDSTMRDFSSLAPGVTTGGNCQIGTHAAVGIGASLRHGISIGEHAVVGGNSMVLEDVNSYTVAYGSPAKAVRSRARGEKYL